LLLRLCLSPAASRRPWTVEESPACFIVRDTSDDLRVAGFRVAKLRLVEADAFLAKAAGAYVGDVGVSETLRPCAVYCSSRRRNAASVIGSHPLKRSGFRLDDEYARSSLIGMHLAGSQ
jgi:hypothetical protein